MTFLRNVLRKIPQRGDNKMHLIKRSLVLAWSLSPTSSMRVLTVSPPSKAYLISPILITLCLLLVQVLPNKTCEQNCSPPWGAKQPVLCQFPQRRAPWRIWALRSGKCFKEQHIHPGERCSQLWSPCDVSTSQGKETGSLLLKKAFIKETNAKYKCNLGLGMGIRPWNDPCS